MLARTPVRIHAPFGAQPYYTFDNKSRERKLFVENLRIS
jgi:hypothetical protein